MNTEERVGKVERRVKNVEEAIVLLTALTDNHNDRLEDSLGANNNLDAKISALIDAQIAGEDKMSSLREKLSALADAQIRSEDRIQNINQALERLTELVRAAHQRLDVLEK